MRIYSGRNMVSSPGSHVHEGEIELVPGAEIVVPKAAIYSRFKAAEVTEKADQMLPGFHPDMVTVNGTKPTNVVAAIIEGVKKGDVKIANTGTKKSLVSLRLRVVEVEPEKPKDTPPAPVADAE